MEKYPNWAPLEPAWEVNLWFTLLWVLLTLYHGRKLIQLIRTEREQRAKAHARTQFWLDWVRRQRP
jgi:hypothetical protein